MTISGFRHAGLETLFRTGTVSGIDPGPGTKIARVLDILDAAIGPGDLAGIEGFTILPGDDKGDGRFALAIAAGWRLTFRFTGEDAGEVELRTITKAISWKQTGAPTPPA
jgi:proteic killer suppression protein